MFNLAQQVCRLRAPVVDNAWHILRNERRIALPRLLRNTVLHCKILYCTVLYTAQPISLLLRYSTVLYSTRYCTVHGTVHMVLQALILMLVEHLSPALSIPVDIHRVQAGESWSSFLNVDKQTISCEELNSQWFLFVQEQARARADHRSWHCTECRTELHTVQQYSNCCVLYSIRQSDEKAPDDHRTWHLSSSRQ